ncbi:MAG TPA: hypothetical protein IAC49_09905 [Candidatus Ventricola intestinavium]|nr:hypothetical protein [Candidatus Ventricola intestinavium]
MSGSGKKRKEWIGRLMTAALGLMCALLMGAVFYATMVYQLAGEEEDAGTPARALATPAPLAQGADGEIGGLFPGGLLALGSGTLVSQQAQDVDMGGALCRVITRTYTLADGSQALAVSATPAAYLERLSAENWRAQLITGFVVSGLDAVYALSGQRGMLSARDGDFVYMIEADANEQALYALGASAYLE